MRWMHSVSISMMCLAKPKVETYHDKHSDERRSTSR
jgi:hypothetical protein